MSWYCKIYYCAEMNIVSLALIWVKMKCLDVFWLYYAEMNAVALASIWVKMNCLDVVGLAMLKWTLSIWVEMHATRLRIPFQAIVIAYTECSSDFQWASDVVAFQYNYLPKMNVYASLSLTFSASAKLWSCEILNLAGRSKERRRFSWKFTMIA